MLNYLTLAVISYNLITWFIIILQTYALEENMLSMMEWRSYGMKVIVNMAIITVVNVLTLEIWYISQR